MKISSRVIIALLVLLITQMSCSHYDELQKDVQESSAGDDESHNSGQNCGSCHNKNGHEATQEGRWWTVSGTVFNASGRPLNGATIELFEKPNRQGKMVKSLVSDEKGNFYTNQIINVSAGLYPSVTYGSKQINMGPTYAGGSCNACHGVNVNAITIK